MTKENISNENLKRTKDKENINYLEQQDRGIFFVLI